MLKNRPLDARPNYTLEDMDRDSLFHPFTSIATHMEKGPHIIDTGRGCGCVITVDETYLIALAGFGV